MLETIIRTLKTNILKYIKDNKKTILKYKNYNNKS